MLPELAGKRVLDLGCGYGWFCRAARDLGAADVVGIDLSAKMLARAAELTRDATIRYRQGIWTVLRCPMSLSISFTAPGAALPA